MSPVIQATLSDGWAPSFIFNQLMVYEFCSLQMAGA